MRELGKCATRSILVVHRVAVQGTHLVDFNVLHLRSQVSGHLQKAELFLGMIRKVFKSCYPVSNLRKDTLTRESIRIFNVGSFDVRIMRVM